MKAALIDAHGDPEALRYGELPDPVAGPGEVVVDVHAASVNAADWKVRRGLSGAQKHFPYVLGRDFSGVVSALGDGVDEPRIGDPVFGVCEQGQEGAYAEKIAVNAGLVARKPDGLRHTEAAALALAGLTALVCIEDALALQPGETILVQGGAGGVASLAVQIARHIGARVLTTASAANHPYLRELGAELIIDYNTEDFVARASGCDAVLDTVGGAVAERSFLCLRPGGRAAFVASGPHPPRPPRSDLTALRPDVRRDRPHLERLLALLAAGAIRIPEITTFPLAEAAAAHRLSESRHLRGKLVLTVR